MALVREKVTQIWSYLQQYRRGLQPDLTDGGSSATPDAADRDEFEVLFDAKEERESSGKPVLDRFGFPVPHRSVDMYTQLQETYEQYLAVQANLWEQLIRRMQLASPGAKLKRDAALELAYERERSAFLSLVRGGVPSEHRSTVWLLCSGEMKSLRTSSGLYVEILMKRAKEKSEAVVQIDKDIPRTFGSHALFARHDIRMKLRRILVAFSWTNEQVGYCQGLNFIAGLLMLFADEEPCFWILHYIVRDVAIDYYATDMAGVEADMRVLRLLLQQHAPRAMQRMDEIGADISLNCMKWLPCLGVGCFPNELVVRMFDRLFVDGIQVLFRVIVALYKANQDAIATSTDPVAVLRIMDAAAMCAYDTQSVLQAADALAFPPDSQIQEMRLQHLKQVAQDRMEAAAMRHRV